MQPNYAMLKEKALEIVNIPGKDDRKTAIRKLTENGYSAGEKAIIQQYIANIRKEQKSGSPWRRGYKHD